MEACPDEGFHRGGSNLTPALNFRKIPHLWTDTVNQFEILPKFYTKHWLPFAPTHHIFIPIVLILSIMFLQGPESRIKILLDSSKIMTDGIPHLDPGHEAILIPFHAVLDKGYLDPNYVENVLALDPASVASYEEHYGFLPLSLTEIWRQVELYRSREIKSGELVKQIRKSFTFERQKKSILKRIFRRFWYILRGPEPIVFLGPDGAGKSTLVDKLSSLKWPLIRKE